MCNYKITDISCCNNCVHKCIDRYTVHGGKMINKPAYSIPILTLPAMGDIYHMPYADSVHVAPEQPIHLYSLI